MISPCVFPPPLRDSYNLFEMTATRRGCVHAYVHYFLRSHTPPLSSQHSIFNLSPKKQELRSGRKNRGRDTVKRFPLNPWQRRRAWPYSRRTTSPSTSTRQTLPGLLPTRENFNITSNYLSDQKQCKNRIPENHTVIQLQMVSLI